MPAWIHGSRLLIAGLALVCAEAAAGQTTVAVAELQRVGPPSVEWGSLSDVETTARGDLWIADGLAGEVYVVSGGPVKRVAGQGSGPGEVQPGALELVVLPGDRVVVVEPQAARMSLFLGDGGFVRSWSLEAVDGLTSGWRVGTDGHLYARVNRQTLRQPGAGRSSAADPIVAYDLQGKQVRVAAELPSAESFRMGPGGRPTVTLLGSQSVWDLDPAGGVLFARTDTYRVQRVGTGGERATVVSRAVGGSPVSSEIAQKARELLGETMAARRMPAAAIEALAASAAVAEEGPVLAALMAGPGGTIWVQEPALSAADLVDLERPGGRLWRIFTSAGNPLGTAELPRGFRPTGWRQGHVYGISADGLGRTGAVVLRIDGLR